MPRYMMQRTFPNGSEPRADDGAEIRRVVVERNAEEGITRVHSCVSADKRTICCTYNAPKPGRPATTARNNLLVDQITQVQHATRLLHK